MSTGVADAFSVSGSSPPRKTIDSLRQRVRSGQAEGLQDHELLAVLVGQRIRGDAVELAHRLLDGHGILGLARSGLRALLDRGAPPSAAIGLIAVFDIARRLATASLPTRAKLNTPEAVARAVGPRISLLIHEELWCLPLDPQSRLIGAPAVVSKGDVDGTDAGPRAFFRLALAAGATTCIAVHNHPGGDPHPSTADRAATQRLVAAGRTVDVLLADHVVVGDGGRFVSLRRSDPGLFR